ncbi:MAG: DUF4342 domain-containing protein [Clostridia bacterium]|nr:DUF4342 domain-containing protein [Clostridia bacterium]
MAKNFLDELTGCRVKVKKDGKEILNVPGILALPGLLFAPRAGIIGMIAAPLLGCSIHLENKDGGEADIGKAVKETADTFADRAAETAKNVLEQIEKAWNDLSADDPEGCPEGEEYDGDPAGQGKTADDIPTIHVNPDDSDKE